MTSPEITEHEIVIQKNWDLRRKLVVWLIIPALFTLSIVTTIPIVIIYGLDVTSIPIAPILLATIVAEWLVITGAYFIGGMKTFIKPYFKINKWWHPIIGALVGVAGFVGLQGGAILIEALSGNVVESSNTSTQLVGLTGIWAPLVLVGVVAVLGPFTEEVLFRGVVVGNLRASNWNAPWISVLFSALIFGVMHIQGFSSITDFFVMGWTTLLGAVFAILFLKTKSIWTSVTAHVTYNLITSILILIGQAFS